MDLPISDAIKNIPFVVLGVWPINLVTLLAQRHGWGWESTPDALMGLWEWGAFASLSLVILIELGVEMFIALGRQRRRLEQARKEGRSEGKAQAEEALVHVVAEVLDKDDLARFQEALAKYRARQDNGDSIDN